MNKELKILIDNLEKRWCIDTKPQKTRWLPPNHIEDETKSVLWNKDFVERNNLENRKEIARLKDYKKQMVSKVENDIVKYISIETKLKEDKAEALWIYAYNKYHSYGGYEIGYFIEELCELANKITK